MYELQDSCWPFTRDPKTLVERPVHLDHTAATSKVVASFGTSAPVQGKPCEVLRQYRPEDVEVKGPRINHNLFLKRLAATSQIRGGGLAATLGWQSLRQ